MLGATTTNVVSDSQESAIIDEEIYKDIEATFGGQLPMPDINEEVFEEKYNINQSSSVNVSTEKKLKIQIDDFSYQYMYEAECNNDQLHFQYTFGDGGGQDWVINSAS